jgi:hypothetical protein
MVRNTEDFIRNEQVDKYHPGYGSGDGGKDNGYGSNSSDKDSDDQQNGNKPKPNPNTRDCEKSTLPRRLPFFGT